MASVSPGYSITVRVQAPPTVGATADLAAAVLSAGGALTALDVVESKPDGIVVDVTCNASDADHADQITDAIAQLAGVTVRKVSDRTFLLHLGGKIEVSPEGAAQAPRRSVPRLHPRRRPGLPGHRQEPGRRPPADDQAQHRRGGHRRDGRARPRQHRAGRRAAGDGGQGGPVQALRRGRRLAGLPRHQRRRRDRRDRQGDRPRSTAASTSRTSPRRAASRSSAGCAELLDIPVFHDDQHGTAIVVLAALTNALRVVGKRLEDVHIVVCGVGAAGHAIIRLLAAQGATDIIGCDRHGALDPDAEGMRRVPRLDRRQHQPERHDAGTLAEMLAGADVFIGVSAPNLLTGDDIATMADERDRLRPGQPRPRGRPARRQQARRRRRHRTLATTRTRSTTCSPSPASSAACSTPAPATSPTR